MGSGARGRATNAAGVAGWGSRQLAPACDKCTSGLHAITVPASSMQRTLFVAQRGAAAAAPRWVAPRGHAACTAQQVGNKSGQPAAECRPHKLNQHCFSRKAGMAAAGPVPPGPAATTSQSLVIRSQAPTCDTKSRSSGDSWPSGGSGHSSSISWPGQREDTGRREVVQQVQQEGISVRRGCGAPCQTGRHSLEVNKQGSMAAAPHVAASGAHLDHELDGAARGVVRVLARRALQQRQPLHTQGRSVSAPGLATSTASG